MKTALLLAGALALVGPHFAEPGYELTVTASGLNWKVNWTKAVIDGLKRLSGAKEASQDDFSGGVATFKVKYDAMPAVKLSDVKSAVGKYKLDKTQLKITYKAVEKNKKWTAGPYLLTGDTSKLAELKGKLLVLVGNLTEGEKGVPTLELTSVEEVTKK